MNGLISFAIVCLLACLHVSARFPKDLEPESNSIGFEQLLPLEDWDISADVSDAMSSKNEADDITDEMMLKMESFDDLLHLHQNFMNMFQFKCWNNTCEICYLTMCLKITHMQPENKFLICAMYNTIPIYCKKISVQGFRLCTRIPIINIKACVAILDMKISNGRACLDLQVSAETFVYTFRNLCVGTSYLE